MIRLSAWAFKQKGQSLAEYGLLLSMVALVCVAALTFMGEQIGDAITHLANQLNGSITGTQVATGGPPVTVGGVGQNPLGGKSFGIGGKVPAPGAGEEQACFKSGLCVNIPFVNAGPVVETTGGLGGEFTMSIANSFHQLADQLEAAGGSPAEVDAIRKLATSGHTIGGYMESVDIGQLSCGGTPASMCANGKTRSENFDQYINKQVAEEKVFESLWNDVKLQLGGSSNPVSQDIMAIINYEASQIKTVYDGQYNMISAGSFETKNKAVLVHHSASVICNTGGSSGC